MDVLLTLLGVALIVVGLWDMYHSLLHPSGSGAIGGRVQAAVWRTSRRLGHRFGSAVGPGSMITVVVVWVLLQALGWALIYYPHVPEGFTYSPGIDPSDYSAFGEALYVSMVTLATLGYGDVVATDPALRLAAPLEALTGFALLTAALTWFTQVYPPLARRRALALHLKSLGDVGYAAGIGEEDPTAAALLLDGVTAAIVQVRVDLAQHGETYFFQEQDPHLSLARQLPCALELRECAERAGGRQLRTSAQRLGAALEELSDKLREDFLGTGDSPAEVFAAYAADHGRNPRR